jgi:hypothetical protein
MFLGAVAAVQPGSILAAIAMFGLVLALPQTPARPATGGAAALPVPGRNLVHADSECPDPRHPLRGCPY